MSNHLIELQQRFVNHRFGMFIHFNSATYQFSAGELVDWEYEHENGGKPRLHPFDPKDWNPAKLDPAQWARAAKAAGCEFAALTTKHHEGFDLWPSQYTEHSVKNGAVKTDVVRAYLDAFRAEGIRAGIYFSMLDLTHQIGRKKCTPQDVELIKNQLTELLTNYGEIPFVIVDGWQAHWGGPSYANLPFEEVDALVKGLQPDCLLMNISCENNLNHSDIVFYESGAGQQVDADFVGPGTSCNHLTGQWFWRADDPIRELRSAKWVIDTIYDVNDHNCCFILNASPNTLGRLDDNMQSRFEEIGKLYAKRPPLEVLPEGWLTANR